MKRVKIPFYPRFEKPMLAGTKRCTARTSKKGNPGDRFEAFGAEFEIERVDRRTPDEIARTMWYLEGCASEDDFRATWRKIHPRLPWTRLVYLHWFRRVKS